MNKKIVLTLVPLIASVLSGCGDDQNVTRACLDQNGTAVPAQKCEDMYAHNGQVDGWYPWFYYWYYYPHSTPIVIGSRAPYGGTFVAPEGAEFGHGATSGVVRGGFGSSAGFSAGE